MRVINTIPRLIALLLAVALTSCATPTNIGSVSSPELRRTRAALQQKLDNDELGVYVGPIRWVSHALSERGVTNARKEIDAELARRQALTGQIQGVDGASATDKILLEKFKSYVSRPSITDQQAQEVLGLYLQMSEAARREAIEFWRKGINETLDNYPMSPEDRRQAREASQGILDELVKATSNP